MSEIDDGPPLGGFEFRSEFYRWHVSTIGKDLMLVDRISGLSISDFLEQVSAAAEDSRPSLLLSMIATSIRFAHPDWSVERIVRLVMNLDLDEIELVAGDADEDDRPLAPAEPPTLEPSDEPSPSTNGGSSHSSTPAEPSTLETSSGTPA